MSLTDKQYLEENESMFSGPDETEIRCRTTKVGKVRKEQMCMCPDHRPPHAIKPGERAVIDRAIADGTWGTCYVCLPCLESWAKHCKDGSEYCTVRARTPRKEEA